MLTCDIINLFLSISQSKGTFDPVILWKSALYGFVVVGLMFFTCEIGQRFTELFEEIDYDFERLNWYLFPYKIQRILPTILVGVQKPLVIGYFGVFEACREQFKKVSSFK